MKIPENKMAYMPMNQLILQMSLPPLFSMFLQYSYNLVDSMFVAGVDEQALAAISLSFPITTLMNALSIWIGVGINVLIAGYLGQKNQDKADSAVTLGLLVSLCVGMIVNALAFFILKPYFAAFTNNAKIYQYGMRYMSVCVFMQVPNMVHIVVQKILQATGNMIVPMWFQIAGVAVNFVLDPLLIFGLGPFPELGVAGAAIATVMGYTVSMVIAIIILLRTKQKVKIKVKGFHMETGMLKKLVTFGTPSFIMNALGSFMVSFVNLFLVGYSDTAIAFFGAYFKVQQLIVMTVNGLIQGCLPIMRFNYGAKKQDRLNSAFQSGTRIATGMMVVGMAVLLIFPKGILKLFSASDAMLLLGIPAMRILSLGFVFGGLSTMIATYLQAIEKVGKSMVIQLFRQGIFLIPMMWLLERLFGITGIWMAFPITEFVVLGMAMLMRWNLCANRRKSENE